MKRTINRRDALKKTALLMGYAVSATAIASVMNGCVADPKAVQAGLENWTPSFFNKIEGQLIAQISECIIPKTDTPGAIDTGVYSFIDVYFKDNVETKEQLSFKESINAFEIACKNHNGKSFLECNQAEKIDFLKTQETQAFEKVKANENAVTFWFTMKELTFLGYFTSEAGAKQFLKYDPIPGEYNACIPLDDVGGTWYTL